MKTLLFSTLALSLVAVGVVLAEPVNATCIMTGRPVDKTIVTKHNGKEVGFCTEKCKARFETDPAKFGKKIK